MGIDLSMTLFSDEDSGDLQLAAATYTEGGVEKRDLALTTSQDAIKQIVYSRIRTQAPDWFLHPSLGGNLEDLIGEPNTKETARVGIQSIQDALTYDGFMGMGQFEIRAIPISADEIVFIIKIYYDNQDIIIPLAFSYTYGLQLEEGVI
ncbi:MAG: hypothetical protein NWF07_04835 [Candidatus Bathyarchaeota archaeon]|nr:hypothetical protein [Candidatus Bathyarchaeota archaeon]